MEYNVKLVNIEKYTSNKKYPRECFHLYQFNYFCNAWYPVKVYSSKQAAKKAMINICKKYLFRGIKEFKIVKRDSPFGYELYEEFYEVGLI